MQKDMVVERKLAYIRLGVNSKKETDDTFSLTQVTVKLH